MQESNINTFKGGGSTQKSFQEVYTSEPYVASDEEADMTEAFDFDHQNWL